MNGFYIGSMGMMAFQQQLNTVSNNIANSQTNGYKFDTMVSSLYENLQGVRKNDDSGTIGINPEKVVNVNSPINWTEGSYQITEEGLDLAIIDGEEGQTTFFVTNNENGTYLTRNGEFEVNENRELRTKSGEFILDVNNQRITISEEQMNGLSVNKEGYVVSGSGENIAQLQLKTVVGDERSRLNKSENGKFEYRGNINDLQTGAFSVEQGTIETSNVSMASQLVELMNTQRMFQASSKSINIFDNIYDKAANKLI